MNRYALGVLLFLVSTCAAASVAISDIKPYDFGMVIPDGNRERITQTVCIYNSASTKYQITASSPNTQNDRFYMVRSGSSDTIRYRVRWDGPKGRYETLTPNVAQNFNGASTSSPVCAGVSNNKLPKLRIQINGGWLSPTPISGAYSDTLMITVGAI